jgi:pilus assembly protein Flp/PilA
MTTVKRTDRDGTGQPNREADDTDHRQFLFVILQEGTTAMVQYVIGWLNLHFAMKEEEGQGLVEYALIIVLVAIAAIAALGLLSGGINHVFSSISSTLNGTGSSSSSS